MAKFVIYWLYMIDDSSQQSNQDTKSQQQSSSNQQTPSSLIEEKKPEGVSVSTEQPKPEDQSQAVPVEASSSQDNQSAPPADISQQSSDWPNSTNLANDQPTTSVSPQPVTFEEKPKDVPTAQEPPKERKKLNHKLLLLKLAKLILPNRQHRKLHLPLKLQKTIGQIPPIWPIPEKLQFLLNRFNLSRI